MTRKEIKQRAREQLGNKIFGENWLYALLACLIFSAILGACTATGFGSVATIILEGPLSFGLAYLFLKQARDGEKMELGDLFCGFKNDFGELLVLGLLQSIFIALWSMLLIVPGIVKSYSYSMSFYLKNDHPEYNWKQSIDESRKLMKGHKWDLFVLDLSFLGWIIVGSLIFGIGLLWVIPYITAAHAQFYESIKADAAVFGDAGSDGTANAHAAADFSQTPSFEEAVESNDEGFSYAPAEEAAASEIKDAVTEAAQNITEAESIVHAFSTDFEPTATDFNFADTAAETTDGWVDASDLGE